MTAGTFVEARLAELDPKRNGPQGQAFARALGAAQDVEIRLATDAALFRYATRAPTDHLDAVGEGYLRRRAPRETEDHEAYRARIGAAWAFWEKAPRLTGFVEAMTPYFEGDFRPIWLNNADGAIGGALGWYSRAWGAWCGTFEPDATWDEDAGTWDDGGLWNIFFDPADPYTAPSFGVADLAWVRAEYALIKGSTAYPVVIALGLAVDALDSGPVWGDGGTWDDGGDWDDPDPGALVYLRLLPVWNEEEIDGNGAASWDTPGDTWE